MSVAPIRLFTQCAAMWTAARRSAFRAAPRWFASTLLMAAGVGCGDSTTAPVTAPSMRPSAPSMTLGGSSLTADRYPAEWSAYPYGNPAGIELAYPIRVATMGIAGPAVEEVVGSSGASLLGTVTHLANSPLRNAADAAALRAQFDVLVITNAPYNQVTMEGIEALLDAGGGVLLEDQNVIPQLYSARPLLADPSRTYRFPPASVPALPLPEPALTRELEGALGTGTLMLLKPALHTISNPSYTSFIETMVGSAANADLHAEAAALFTERFWGAGNMGGRLIVQGFALATPCPVACSYGTELVLLRNEIQWLARNAVNQPPRVDAGGNAGSSGDEHYAGSEGSPIAVVGNAFDNEFGPGVRLTGSWDFDSDGSVEVTTQSTNVSDSFGGAHTWPDDGNYSATFSATDANGVTRSTTIPVRVANVSPTVTVATDATIEVGRRLVLDAAFTDPGADNPWRYVVRWGDEPDGTQPAPQTLKSPGSFTASHVFSAVGTYRIRVEVTDKDGGSGTAIVSVTVLPSTNRAPVASAGGPYAGNEGALVPLSAVGSSDPDGDDLSYAWDLDADGAYDDAIGATPTATFADDGVYTIGVKVTDGIASSTATTTVTVANVRPVIGTLTFAVTPLPVGSPVTVSAPFTDAGALDSHSAQVQWDVGGTWEPAVISAGTIRASRTLPVGVYTIALRVTDDDGGSDDEVTTGYVVVYDPNGAFVTGGGWIGVSTGDCSLNAACAGAAGKATFGFVSKYLPGRNEPSGNTEFEFKAGDFRFRSASYEWLTVAGARAQYKGVGTVNGGGSYGFLITAVDGDISGGKGVDRFRIKIWNRLTEATVFDNQRGNAEDSDASTALGGGSIVIHKQ